MIIGLVPGAMKPYHAGHHFLVEKASEECDKVIIITTTKDRKNLSGKKMKLAWDKLITPKLNNNTEVSFVVSPIGTVFDMMEEENKNPTCHQYRIYGGTEDRQRFNQDYIETKWPNIKNRFINVADARKGDFQRGVGLSPLAKGEWIRSSIVCRDSEKFRSYLPELLKPIAEEYLSTLAD